MGREVGGNARFVRMRDDTVGLLDGWLEDIYSVTVGLVARCFYRFNTFRHESSL